jgi:hypothetical protein
LPVGASAGRCLLELRAGLLRRTGHGNWRLERACLERRRRREPIIAGVYGLARNAAHIALVTPTSTASACSTSPPATNALISTPRKSFK